MRQGHLDAMRKLIEEAALRAEMAARHDLEAYGDALVLRGLLDPDKRPALIDAARKRSKRSKRPEYWREQEAPFLDRVHTSLEQAAEASDPVSAATLGILMDVAACELIEEGTDHTRGLREDFEAVKEALAETLPSDPERLRLALQKKTTPRLHERAAKAALRALNADGEIIKRLGD